VLRHRNARGRRIDLDQLIAEPVDRRIKQSEEIDQDGGCAVAYSQNMETAGEALVLSADNARSMRVPCDVNLSAPSKSSNRDRPAPYALIVPRVMVPADRLSEIDTLGGAMCRPQDDAKIAIQFRAIRLK
jgi:hypothetical protein